MVGYLRLALAYLVLLSHLNVRLFDLNPGVIAVVVFYILAGWVVTHLWDSLLPQGPGRLGRLLRDRLLRIYPLYGYVCLLTVLFLLLTDYGHPDFSLRKLLANALIVPLNYFMWFDSEVLQQPAWCLVPPAWSLGAELQAYAAMLLIFRFSPLKWLLALASLGVYLLANFGVFDCDIFGYRLLPGVFFVFICGHSLCRSRTRSADGFDRFAPLLVWGVVALIGLVLWRQNLHRSPYVIETMLGLLIGLPLVRLVHGARLRLPGNGLCGALSYGVFLSHFIVIWTLDYAGLSPLPGFPPSGAYLAAVTAGSLCIAWCGVRFLEAPINRYRLQENPNPDKTAR